MGSLKYAVVVYVLLAICIPISAQEGYSDYLSGFNKTVIEGKTGTINVPKANVRYGPDQNNYRIIVTLRKGDKVTVYGKKGNWYEIIFPSQGHVWVFGDFVDLLGNQGTINANNVTIRDDARFDGIPIGSINKGQKVQVVSQRGKWYRIAPPPELRAYISAGLVELSGPSYQESKVYFQDKISQILRRTSWAGTPEGQHVQQLDKQLWTYRTGISLKKTSMEELEQMEKDTDDIKAKLNKVREATDSNRIRAEVDIVLKKARKTKKYVQAVMNFKKNYLLIEKTYKKNIGKLLEKKASSERLAGYVDDTGRYIGRSTPYVLKKGDEIICFLKSVELSRGGKTVPVINFRKYLTKEYYRYEIEITDYVKLRKRGPMNKPVIKVRKLREIGPHNW